MHETWRLIQDRNQLGSFNMAADQVLINQFKPGDPPVLRLYTWDRLTLSIGRNQHLEQDIDWNWLAKNEIAIIRRSTGGKAVLHGNDLTYSIVGGVNDGRFSGGILQTYQTISQGFAHFFKTLGLAPQIQEHSTRDSLSEGSHVCFSVPSSFEILIDGKKIIGSAQRQTSRAFLQHGTIPLTNQIPILSNIFKGVSPESLHQEITSLETENVSTRYSFDEICQLLIDSFQQTFHIQFNHQEWANQERAAIENEENAFQPIEK